MNIIIKKNKNVEMYKGWPIWSCEISKFDWEYSEEEHCFVIEGEVIVTTKNNHINISKGDYVIFPKGLKCHWDVIKPIRKYYDFK